LAGGGIGRSVGVIMAEKYGVASFILMTLALVLVLSIPVYIYYLLTEQLVFSFLPYCTN
jgi:hypothetical protein